MALGSFKKIMLAFFAGVLVMLLLGAGILFWQKSYFDSLLFTPPPDTQTIQAVVVFEGGIDRIDKAVEEANRVRADYYIISSGNLEDMRFNILQAGGLRTAKLYVNGQAGTTDSDARYAADLLKKFKVNKAILVTSWFHLPRSAFLLRLYLCFSGIKIIPVSSDTPPPHAWKERVFQIEFVKFWGSLLRAGLYALHLDTHGFWSGGIHEFLRKRASLLF